jgi:hypothetical protein
MKTSVATCAAAVTIAWTVFAQTINPSARSLLHESRPLLGAEIAKVLDASRQAVAGRAARLSYVAGGPGIDVVMGANGRPRMMRMTSGSDSTLAGAFSSGGASGTIPPQTTHVDLVTVIDYTGAPAQSCDGRPIEGELVIEYEHRAPPGAWTAKARTRSTMEVGGPIFEMLSGAIAMESVGFRAFGDRQGRAFSAAWKPPAESLGGPPPGTTQTLWIDVDSLLPLRWSLALPPPPDRAVPAIADYGLSFTYDASIDVSAPADVMPPACVR